VAWLELTIAYVQNTFLVFDFTQLLQILKDYPAARLAIVMFIVTASTISSCTTST
jgi:hypothetical protein